MSTAVSGSVGGRVGRWVGRLVGWSASFTTNVGHHNSISYCYYDTVTASADQCTGVVPRISLPLL